MEEKLKLVPPVFHGQFEVACDDKNRILIPAAHRKCVDPAQHGVDFVLIPAANGEAWMYCKGHYDHVAKRESDNVPIGEEVDKSDKRVFGLAEVLELDKQGRILLPTRTFEWTGLKRNSPLYVVGVRHHLRLVDKDVWDQERRELLSGKKAE